MRHQYAAAMGAILIAELKRRPAPPMPPVSPAMARYLAAAATAFGALSPMPEETIMLNQEELK